MSLTLSGLCVEVQGFRLKDISFQVEQGKCLVIVGPSGAGKTLLLDTIAGVYTPKKGTILLAGRDITRARPEERNLGYLPQNLALFPHLSVLDNILFGARARKIPLEKARARVKELAELLRIEHLLDRPSPLTLSGGEKQRVALARALLVEPSVILLDEPFSALDNFIKRELIFYLKEVFSTLKNTVIHVTHDLQEAFLLADILGVMLEGRLEQVGPREEICYRPHTLGVARLFAGSNIFHGHIVEINPGTVVVKTFRGLTLELPSKEDFRLGQRVVFGISPREIMIIRPGRPLRAKVQVNVLPAQVVSILDSYGSHLVFLQLEDSGEKAELEIPSYVFRDLSLNPGSMVEVCFKKDYLWVLPEE
ncbi:molybdate transport system ATP-binding protein [Thermanaeromonas toyohensis ToBE]|uniref:Molybdate transport system ATP-binding protein n=1 Tax=Thermanaeromonas toyohensis ToBE TaxID=698762 RepID=A0A1W1VEJ7_9FIRM|nr:ATP-binding cassette domain-containing protein [Thermanaeromonas toyohensis]SMB91620.1 molybdate transport system ATP-binding protein [Thermanaeromonas toyohensis ToBE]